MPVHEIRPKICIQKESALQASTKCTIIQACQRLRQDLLWCAQAVGKLPELRSGRGLMIG